MGVFYNDVIVVSNCQVLFCYEQVFVDQIVFFQQLVQWVLGFMLLVVFVSWVLVVEVVVIYLFNSQLLSWVDGSMVFILFQEVQEYVGVWEYFNELLVGDNFIVDLWVFDLCESMVNGGGLVCLCLWVVLMVEEYQVVNLYVLMNDMLFVIFNDWVDCYYCDCFIQIDFVDLQLLWEGCDVLDWLIQILQFGLVYLFQ